MTSCEVSTDRSAKVVFSNAGSLSLLRIQRVLPIIIVLILCALVIPVQTQLDQATCGKRQVNTVFLVSNGVASTKGRWPWHAGLYLPIQHQLTYACGGTIIGKNIILTAAHCLFANVRPFKKDEISVQVGRVDLTEITPALQVLAVSELIIHPEFNVLNVAHDIAIIKLSSEITMTRFVHPVCVWIANNDQSQIIGKKGTVIGFGRNERDELPGFLQEANLTVVDGITCLSNDRETYGPVLTHNVYCAGGQPGVSACNGDSGGGMFFEKYGTWYVRGIVSFIASLPNGLCDSSKYTVFTDVSKYSSWVSQFIDSPVRPTHRFDGNFLLVNDEKYITRVPLNGGQIYRLIEGSNAGGFDYDCVEGRLYWGDINFETAFSANYDGTDVKKTNITAMNGVAVDWISRRIYWANTDKARIEVASLENLDVRTVLISTNLIQPQAIAVDPFRNKLYWSDADVKEPKIEWSNLDGTDRQLLVGSPRIEFSISMEISNATGELCYIDGKGTDKIACIDPISKKIRTIASNLTHSLGVAITDDRIYWNNQPEKRIESISMGGVRQKPITSPLFEDNLYHMKLVTDKCPIFYSPCATNNGDCPANTICLVNTRASSGRICRTTLG